MVSSFTLPIRQGEPFSLSTLLTNLVSHPRLHYIQAAHAPLLPEGRSFFEPQGAFAVTAGAFGKGFLSSDKYYQARELYSFLLYRGDLTHVEILRSIKEVTASKSLDHPNHVPTSIKLAVSRGTRLHWEGQDLGQTARAVSRLYNNSGVKLLFERILEKYDRMYRKRAFVHWYVGEGLSEGFFQEAREDVRRLKRDYEEMQADNDSSSS